MNQRSDEERERARLEREARRAARAGDAAGARPAAPQPEQPRQTPAARRADRPQEISPAARADRVQGAPPTARADRAQPTPPAAQQQSPHPVQDQPSIDGTPPVSPAAPAAAEDRAAPRPNPAARAPRARPHLERPHLRERVDAALERTHARRHARQAGGGHGNGAGPSAPTRKRRRWLLPLLVVVLVVAAAVAWFAISLYQPGKGDGTGRVAVTIPRGGTLGVIAERLNSAGVISKPFFFKLRTRLEGHASDLKPGVYVLKKDMPYDKVITKLTAGPARHVIDVTIPEGRSRSEVAPILKQAGVKGNYQRATVRSAYLNPRTFGAPRGATLEGFLFPATYELKRGATVRALVAKQLAAFKQNFAKVNMAYARRKNLTPYDVITIASMVEREAQLDRERPLIAAVIYNRLKQGIPLGIDATIRFAVNNWTRPLLVSQLKVNSAYNTRTHQGLPPGPIGNPGLASLEAAAHPAHASYLFYVVKPCGNGAHAFSSTDAQFQRDVARYNAARAKKGGNSPAKC